MPSYLITGASRGLGLGFAAELLKNEHNVVVATVRDITSSPGLMKLRANHPDGRLHILSLDVTKPESISAAAEATTKLLPNGLDHLISNAGVSYNPVVTFDELYDYAADIAEFQAEVSFNITSLLLLLREFAPLVRNGQAKRILILTSQLGSIERGIYMPNLANPYAVAKAALNMLARKYSAVLKDDGITTALLHPGWVRETEIGDGFAPWVEKYSPSLTSLTIEQSAADSVKVLNGLTLEDNGLFFNHDGTQIPW